MPPLAAASMWTRKDIKEFKESLQKDKDSCIKIGSGETVTVSSPTKANNLHLAKPWQATNLQLASPLVDYIGCYA